MEYANKTVAELKAICKERNIKGMSSKTKAELIAKLDPPVSVETVPIDLRQEVIHGDALHILPTLESDSAQMIIADPPYNIGKDFGNDSNKQPMNEYLQWCDQWIQECLRILKPNGTMFIYGFSENLALILSKIPYLLLLDVIS